MKIELTTKEAVIVRVLLENFAKQSLTRLSTSGVYPHPRLTAAQQDSFTANILVMNSARSKIEAALAEAPIAQEPIAQKGVFRGTCNMSSCTTGAPALWYNHSTRKYYCEACTIRLNEDPKAAYFAVREFGHELCTFGDENI